MSSRLVFAACSKRSAQTASPSRNGPSTSLWWSPAVPRTHGQTNTPTATQHRSAELGAALRRLEALHFQRAAEQHDGFEPIRITTTRPDGKENALIVGVAEKHAPAVEEAMNAAVNKLAGAIGSKHQAQAALLATLAGQIAPAAPEPDIEPRHDTLKPARENRRSNHA